MQMTVRLALSAVLFVAALVSIGIANRILHSAIDEVNDRMPTERKISHLGGGAPSTILREYLRLYPAGYKAKRFWRLFWLSMALLAAFALVFMFGGG
jgi:hypothetical protein